MRGMDAIELALQDHERKTTAPTKYWTLKDDGRVSCDVCPRACSLAEGQRGMCFVRVWMVGSKKKYISRGF